ncbi:pseudomonapepsin [Reticulibacter mediterranei]|uniref:Pseudomonapepsin n=1 Tax=Reticulibacter mediterranei TaxID=2778369 RepID=A0A8J3IGU4_9CHLR|nr:S53 family peptidase [Reticulibacter mediterranei]GHO90001.1 pseudomonapepsin [Reticulibacter mediterranei]
MDIIDGVSLRVHRKISAGMVGLLAIWLVLAGCGGSDQTAVPTPTPTTSALGNFTTFKLNLPAAAMNAPVKGPLPDDTPMHVAITFKLNQQTMNKLKNSGKSQDLESQANQLGISDATYQKLKQMFGITDAKLTLDGLHTYLTVDGKAKTMALAFQTTFVEHQLNGRTFYAPTSDPKIPTFIAPSVLAITGLDNYTAAPKPHVRGRALNGANPQDDCAVAGQTAQAVASSYGYQQFWNKGWHGEGMTINLLELGPINQQDFQVSAKCFNAKNSMKVIDVDGGPDPNSQADQGAEPEALLDIEMIQAFAPAANIRDYQSTYGSTMSDVWEHFNDILRQIIKDNEKNGPDGSVVSTSYGTYEGSFTESERAAIDQSMQILTDAEHMTIFVASADCGAFDTEQYGTPNVDYPGTSPWGVSVGGTRVRVDQNGKRASEIVWSDSSNKSKCGNAWGSGGGVSSIYQHPDWQKADGVDNKYAHGMRQVPDVSAWAIEIPVYIQGQWVETGGTSAAAPIWASGMAQVNQGTIAQAQTYFNGPEIFYDVANNARDKTPYYDVTQGSNLYYQATRGWDDATGLGTPNLMDFMSVLVALSKQQ